MTRGRVKGEGGRGENSETVVRIEAKIREGGDGIKGREGSSESVFLPVEVFFAFSLLLQIHSLTFSPCSIQLPKQQLPHIESSLN